MRNKHCNIDKTCIHRYVCIFRLNVTFCCSPLFFFCLVRVQCSEQSTALSCNWKILYKRIAFSWCNIWMQEKDRERVGVRQNEHTNHFRSLVNHLVRLLCVPNARTVPKCTRYKRSPYDSIGVEHPYTRSLTIHTHTPNFFPFFYLNWKE